MIKASVDFTKNLQSISASGRWLRCTASLEHNHGIVVDNNAVKRGGRIHEIAKKVIELWKDNQSYIGDYDKDNDIKEVIESYVGNLINRVVEYKATKTQVQAEREVVVDWYGITKRGIIDLLIETEDTLYICDLKTGHNKVGVTEEDELNYQLALYAMGLIQENFQRVNKKIVIEIYQPWGYINNKKEITATELSELYTSKKDKMAEITSGELEYNPTPTACKYCAHRIRCNERFKKGVV